MFFLSASAPNRAVGQGPVLHAAGSGVAVGAGDTGCGMGRDWPHIAGWTSTRSVETAPEPCGSQYSTGSESNRASMASTGREMGRVTGQARHASKPDPEPWKHQERLPGFSVGSSPVATTQTRPSCPGSLQDQIEVSQVHHRALSSGSRGVPSHEASLANSYGRHLQTAASYTAQQGLGVASLDGCVGEILPSSHAVLKGRPC